MQETATKPPAGALYERDFYAWTQEQARLLRERRWSELDLNNLVDEVQSVGGSEKREIRNRLTKLLAHLLKWKFQPGRRGSSWRRSIRDQRLELQEIIELSPSLRRYLHQQVNRRYLGATLEAADETGLAVGLFPEECPFTVDEVFDPEFFPEDPSIE
jgi:Domain of unknown function DUF29